MNATSAGIGYGCVLAMVISYHHNESIPLAIIHGLLNWFYVIYVAIVY